MIARAALLTCVLAIACGFAPPATTVPAATNLAHVIRTLEDEARASRQRGGLVRSIADFARTAGQPPPSQALIEKLTRRIDSDPFIDAYVRWQLTSFEIPAFAMTDAAFERLVDSLPRCIENPRANAALVETLQAVSGRGALAEKQQAEVNDRLNRLASEASDADAFNLPAAELSEWLVERFRDQPHRALTILLARAVALAEAGWPIDDARSALDEAIAKAARRRDFTTEQRRAFIQLLDRSRTRTRMFIASAGVSEGALAVNFATTGVQDYDIVRWTKAVADER